MIFRALNVSASDSVPLGPLGLAILCRALLELVYCLLLVFIVSVLLEVIRGVGVVVATVHSKGSASVSSVLLDIVTSVVCLCF